VFNGPVYNGPVYYGSSSANSSYSNLDDPAWYAETAADLRAEIDGTKAVLGHYLQALALATSGITQPGIDLDQPSWITPEAGLQTLREQLFAAQAAFDDLSDLARRHNIPPGVLRG
jgi:hypothetical protein